MTEIVSEIDSYLKRLFPICRSITGPGNRETLRILQELIPLTIYEIPSGTTVYDWTVPDEWSITDAWIATADGKRIVDFKDNNLHVVGYSEPVNGLFSWEDIASHLHIHPRIPDAIPYRTSYYYRTWGFCVTQAQYQELEQLKGPFEVVIDSELRPGSLSYGELLIPGRYSREVLLSTYICHPSMANDNLSGMVLTAFLARELMNRGGLNYNYRIIFVPETIGAIAYCAVNEPMMKQILQGFVITCVGGPGQYGYKQSFNPHHSINKVIEQVFKEEGIDYIVYPFDIHGSDERQYSSLGLRMNIASITKDRYYEYPYYHTSLDNMNFIQPESISRTLDIYLKVLLKLDNEKFYKNLYPNCEIMLSKHGLYPLTGGGQTPIVNGRDELDLILWLLFLSDGLTGIYQIANQLDIEESLIISIAQKLNNAGILEHIT